MADQLSEAADAYSDNVCAQNFFRNECKYVVVRLKSGYVPRKQKEKGGRSRVWG